MRSKSLPAWLDRRSPARAPVENPRRARSAAGQTTISCVSSGRQLSHARAIIRQFRLVRRGVIRTIAKKRRRATQKISGGNGMRRAAWVLALAAAVAALALVRPAGAEFPTKPIRILVPYAPGGLTDVVSRLFAEQLRKILNNAVFVENKPGASGILAIEEMARSRPDGHTLMIGNISTNGLTPVLLAKKLKIDYDKDVQIVARLVDVPVFFLATTTDFPPKTFAEFLAYARANPGKVRFGSAGVGSYQQVNTAILAKRAGLDMVHIPFKDGGAPILRDLSNGDIHVSWFNITNP